MKIPPIIGILYIQFSATYDALCMLLSQYSVEHDEMHAQIEDDWMEVVALRWASRLNKLKGFENDSRI